MSSVTGRRQLFESLEGSSDSGSVDIARYEENSTASNKDLMTANCDFWYREEAFTTFHSVHEPSLCYYHFVDELKERLNLKFPDGNFESLCAMLKNTLHNTVTCSILEIKRTIENCYKIIQNFEDFGIREGKLLVGKIWFSLVVEDKDSLFCSKDETGANFLAVQSKAARKKDFNKAIKNFCRDLKQDMKYAYTESFKYDSLKEINTGIAHVNYVKELQNYQEKKSDLETLSMRKELEWTKAKTNILKVNLERKMQKIKNREEEVKVESSKLQIAKLKITAESRKLKKDLEEIDFTKTKYLQLQSNLKDFLSSLPRNSVSNANTSFMSTGSLASVENAEFLEEEQKFLEKKLDDLKKHQFVNKPEDKDLTHLEINSIEARLLSMKSEKLVPLKIPEKSSAPITVQRTTPTKQPLPRPNSTAKPKILFSIYTPVLSTGRHSPTTNSHLRSPSNPPPSSQIVKHVSKYNSPIRERLKSPMRAGTFCEQETHNLDADECGLRKFKSLELKEARLSEKEKEINRKLNSIKSSVEKRIYDRDLSEVVRKERVEMEKKGKELEKKEKMLEQKWEEVEKIEDRNVRKERELDKTIGEVESERSRLEAEKIEWARRVEEIQRLIMDSL